MGIIVGILDGRKKRKTGVFISFSTFSGINSNRFFFTVAPILPGRLSSYSAIVTFSLYPPIPYGWSQVTPGCLTDSPVWFSGSSSPSYTLSFAAAKSLQSCSTLCNPIDGSPPPPMSLGFSRQEHWSGLPFPSPMHESEK